MRDDRIRGNGEAFKIRSSVGTAQNLTRMTQMMLISADKNNYIKFVLIRVIRGRVFLCPVARNGLIGSVLCDAA